MSHLPFDVPIPEQMRKLPRDHRGYPVPWTVMVDDAGKPNFVVNQEHLRQIVLTRDLCGICGSKLGGARWFVGGPQSAFHAHGAYMDPPMHGECAHYALQVCPYLALPSYHRFADPQKIADRMCEPLWSNTMMPGRPPLFVAVRSNGTIINCGLSGLIEAVRPVRPYRRVEYWRHGKRLDKAEGERLASEYCARPIEIEPSKLVLPRGDESSEHSGT